MKKYIKKLKDDLNHYKKNKYRVFFEEELKEINEKNVALKASFNKLCKQIEKSNKSINNLNNNMVKSQLNKLNEMEVYKKAIEKEYIYSFNNHFLLLNNILSQNNAFTINNIKKVTFLNSTYDDYHHGCSGTSYIIEKKIRDNYELKNIITIDEIRKIKSQLIPIDMFDDNNFYDTFRKENDEIIKKLNASDSIITNGEGCVSHYNRDTTVLLYLLYICKIRMNKNVILINTSISNSEFVVGIDKDDTLKFNALLKKVLSILDYLAVRDIFSYNYVKCLGNIKLVQAFDSLPIYIKYYYKSNVPKDSNYFLITGGNNVNSYSKSNIFSIIEEVKQKYPNCKIYYLMSEMPNGICNDDILFYESIMNYGNIEKMIVRTTDEWLSAIEHAKFLISGRFHHTIAAFMLNTPFVVFNTNTHKLIGMLAIINKLECLAGLDNNAFDCSVLTGSFPLYEACLQNMVVNLANNNYLFIKETK